MWELYTPRSSTAKTWSHGDSFSPSTFLKTWLFKQLRNSIDRYGNTTSYLSQFQIRKDTLIFISLAQTFQPLNSSDRDNYPEWGRNMGGGCHIGEALFKNCHKSPDTVCAREHVSTSCVWNPWKPSNSTKGLTQDRRHFHTGISSEDWSYVELECKITASTHIRRQCPLGIIHWQ